MISRRSLLSGVAAVCAARLPMPVVSDLQEITYITFGEIPLDPYSKEMPQISLMWSKFSGGYHVVTVGR